MSINTPVFPPHSRTAVFCTAFVDSDPKRYQSWIDYYTRFFAGENIDLYLYNDGPVSNQLNLQGAQLITFEKPLGRPDVSIFPGWKRSFSTAVRQLGDYYQFLGHLESDLLLLPTGREEFLRTLRRPGYWTGFTNYYYFIETALQVINSKRVRRFFAERYAATADFFREENFEVEIQQALAPRIILHGERVGERGIDLHQHYNYFTQMPIHQFFETYPDGQVPWIGSPPKVTPRERYERGLTRLRWRYRHLRSRTG